MQLFHATTMQLGLLRGVSISRKSLLPHNRNLLRCLSSSRFLGVNHLQNQTTNLTFVPPNSKIPVYRVMDTEGNVLEGAKDPEVIHIFFKSKYLRIVALRR